jgi:NAD-dependent deacetylase
MRMNAPLEKALDAIRRRPPRRIVFFTGAGVSAESGIPTFRGPGGYWKVGSRNYQPEELATRAAFERMPEAVWGWYLHRYRTIAAALPNAAHYALAQAAGLMGERCLLITQNVDGLHRRAGSPEAQTYEIHGNLGYVRCLAGCPGLFPAPFAGASLAALDSPQLLAALRCPECGAYQRPHVLWFDEYYDEPLFRLDSSLAAAASAALLVVIGTTGSTNLPLQIGQLAARSKTPIVVINPERNPFSELTRQVPAGLYLEGRAGDWVPLLVRELVQALSRRPGSEH